MARKKDLDTLDKRTLVRIYLPLKLELAIDKFMAKKGINKGQAIESFLLGSETLQKEVEEVEAFYNLN